MNNAKVAIVLIVTICASLAGHTQQSGNVRGVLKDSITGQVLPLATVTIFRAIDTSMITYRLSDPAGVFKVPGIPIGVPSRVLVSFSGYRLYRKDFLLTKEAPQLDLATISISPDPQQLEEVLVLAERPPVTVRNDTIEFNASAFKTLPSALLEDLLKKLPSLDIDVEGNISVKGKRISKLLVDSKEFFGGDAQIATKNLPANIVDKVQVLDDKETIQKNPDIPASEIGQIINIKLKKAIKQGLFGKTYAGAGTDSRYEAGGILNIFRDTTQVSVLGYSNNINRTGFGISDIQRIGGFQRSGVSSMMVSSDGGFALNGVSFGATGQGLQRSSGGGFNFNNQFRNNITMNLQYFYGQVNSEYETISNRQRFFRDTVLSTLSNTASNNVSRNHRIGGTLTWKIDSLTTLTFRPGVTLTNGRNFSESLSATEENYRGKINNSLVTNNGTTSNDNYSYNLYLYRSFRKAGRSLSLNSDLSSIDDRNDRITDGMYTTYNSGFPEDSLVNQLRETGGNNLSGYTSLSFNEPINKRTSLRLSNNIQYFKQTNDILFFDKNLQDGKYDEYNQAFSNGINRKAIKNTTTVAMTYRVKKFSITPGLNFLTANFDNVFTRNAPVSQQLNYLYPSLNINWNSFYFSYQASVYEPPASDLQKIVDISNRFYQQLGNPGLRPTYAQNFYLNYNKFNPKNNHSYGAYLSGDISNDAIIRETMIDRDGIQTTRPINVDGTYRFNGSLNYNYQLRFNKDIRLSIRPAVFGNITNSIISVNGARSGQLNTSLTSSISLGLNYLDKIELNQRYQHSYRQTTYDAGSNFRNLYVIRHSSESEIIIRTPKHVVWESLINYIYNPQVAAGIRKSSVRWNAGVSYLFMKDDKAQVKLSVFDLLNQNILVTRTATENYINDVQTTTLRRYLMVSFIYNIRNFAGGKVGGKDRANFFF